MHLKNGQNIFMTFTTKRIFRQNIENVKKKLKYIEIPHIINLTSRDVLIRACRAYKFMSNIIYENI